jgi:hypothetical protein
MTAIPKKGPSLIACQVIEIRKKEDNKRDDPNLKENYVHEVVYDQFRLPPNKSETAMYPIENKIDKLGRPSKSVS